MGCASREVSVALPGVGGWVTQGDMQAVQRYSLYNEWLVACSAAVYPAERSGLTTGPPQAQQQRIPTAQGPRTRGRGWSRVGGKASRLVQGGWSVRSPQPKSNVAGLRMGSRRPKCALFF